MGLDAKVRGHPAQEDGVDATLTKLDIPWVVNAPLPAEIKSKIESPGLLGAGVSEGGCADSSLYSRMGSAGLSDMQMYPLLITFPGRQIWESQARGVLTGEEASIWDEALDKARAEGTFFISQPLHCVVGTKPT